MAGRRGLPDLFWLHVLYLFLMLGGLIPMLVNGPSDFRDYVEDRSQLPNIIYFSIHFIYLFFILYRAPEMLSALTRLKVGMILLLVCGLSVLYSDAPQRSVIVLVFVALQFLVSIYILIDLPFDRFLKAMSIACFVATVMSLILILAVPSYGRMSFVFPGAWQGIFIHKNVLGRFAVFSFITLLCAGSLWGRYRWLARAGVVLSLILSLGATSATATMCLAIVVVLSMTLRTRVGGILTVIAVIVAGVGTYLMLSLLTDVMLDAFDKSATLSGRTTIWSLAWADILKRPILGYGLSAYWQSDDAQVLRATAHWFVPHAHNGLLEVALSIGLLGGFLYFVMLLQGAAGALRLWRSLKGGPALWGALYMAHAFIYGFGEANYLRPNSFVQVALYAAIYYGSVLARDDMRPGRRRKRPSSTGFTNPSGEPRPDSAIVAHRPAL